MIDWLGELDDMSDKSDLLMDSNEIELMERASEACTGLNITPGQFIRILNKEGKQQIISGELSASTLKDYAKQIDEAIQEGVVDLMIERINIL